MTGRLVAAQLWRLRWHLLILLFLGALGATGTSDPGSFSARLSMGWPLANATSALTMLGIFWSREVRILPIPRRAALRSAWIAAMVLPVAIAAGRLLVTLVKVVYGFPVTLDAEAIALTSVWDTTFIGVSLTLLQLPDEPWGSLKEGFSGLRKSGKLLLILTWTLAVPFCAPELAPSALAEVTWLHLVGVVVAIVITAWPLTINPGQWPTLGVVHDGSRAVEPTATRLDSAPRRLDRLTGMRRLLPGPVATATVASVFALCAGTGFIFALRGTLSPFASGTPEMVFFLIGGPLFLLVLGPFVWASGITPFLRSLKSLPVSTMQIVMTMTMLPLVMPVFFWVLAAGVHLAVGEQGAASWRLGSFALLCGVMAFSGAVHARFNSVLVILAGSGGPVIGVLTLMMFFDRNVVEPVIALWFPIIGLIGVPAAFLLNYWTVTRGASSSPAYRGIPGASLYRGSRP